MLSQRKQSALRRMENLNLVDEKRHDNRKWRFKIENSHSNAEAFIRLLELKCTLVEGSWNRELGTEMKVCLTRQSS